MLDPFSGAPIIWKKRNWLTPWFKCKRAMVVWWPWRKHPRIYVPLKRKGDIDALERTLDHERVHVTQWKEFGRLGFIRRYLRRRTRLHMEAEAYAMSVRWWLERGEQTITIQITRGLTETFPVVIYYARALKRGYWLRGITQDDCAKAIRGWMNP